MSFETSSLSTPLPPSPLPPTRCFDLLPPELLQVIVEEAAYLKRYPGEPYRGDKSILQALSLVSRRFHAIAQPLLLRTVVFDSPSERTCDDIEPLVDRNTAQALGCIKKLVLANRHLEIPDSNRLAALAQAAVNLEDLDVEYHGSRLNHFFGSSLTTLTIFGTSVQDSLISSFKRLKNLYLYDCSFVSGGGGEALQFQLPSLRHLVWGVSTESVPIDQLLFLESAASTLVSAVIDLDQLILLPPKLVDNPSVNILYDARIDRTTHFSTSIDLVKHLRIMSSSLAYACAEQRAALAGKHLKVWTDLIAQSKSLRFLYLPLAAPGFQLPPALCEVLTNLLKVCRERGIRVVREEEVSWLTFRSTMSESFLRTVENQ